MPQCFLRHHLPAKWTCQPSHLRNPCAPLQATRGVFVNIALQEPFGLTVIEAAAHGVPTVATKNGGPVVRLGWRAERGCGARVEALTGWLQLGPWRREIFMPSLGCSASFVQQPRVESPPLPNVFPTTSSPGEGKFPSWPRSILVLETPLCFPPPPNPPIAPHCPQDIMATLHHGVVVDPTDSDAVAAALLGILTHPQTWDDMSTSGVKNIMVGWGAGDQGLGWWGGLDGCGSRFAPAGTVLPCPPFAPAPGSIVACLFVHPTPTRHPPLPAAGLLLALSLQEVPGQHRGGEAVHQDHAGEGRLTLVGWGGRRG